MGRERKRDLVSSSLELLEESDISFLSSCLSPTSAINKPAVVFCAIRHSTCAVFSSGLTSIPWSLIYTLPPNS